MIIPSHGYGDVNGKYVMSETFSRGYGLKSSAGPRELNEDTAFIKDMSSRSRRTRYLCVGIIADGMGGHQAGEVASSEAVQAFFEAFNAKKIPYEQDYSLDTRELMREIFSSVNSTVYDIARRDNKLKGMGTTLTAFIAEKGRLTVGHVGDTRAYLVQEGSISQLTQDHTLVEDMVRDRIITREQAAARSDRNVITRAIGVDPAVDVDITTVPLSPRDVVFLCTDGLYEVVSNHDILLKLSEADSMQSACQGLVQLAIANGTTDNVTAVAWQAPEITESGAYAVPEKASSDTVVLTPRERHRGLPLEDLRTRRRKKLLIIALFALVVLVGFLLGWLVAGWVKNRGGDTQGVAQAETEKQEPGGRTDSAELRRQTYVVLLNAAGSTGEPALRAERLIMELGYAGSKTGTAKNTTKTIIYYGEGDREKADLVAEDLHLDPSTERSLDPEVVSWHKVKDKESDVIVVLADDWDIP